MTGSSRPSASRASAGLVVMGCASEDAESLDEAMEDLRRDGLEVELCEGLDHEPRRLSDVIDHHQGRGLYVLCRSARLDRERVEELREILLARHVPFARTLTVAVGGRGALADRIRAGLRRASARASGPNRAVGFEAASRPLNATEDEEPTLVGKREQGVPEELELVPSRPMPLPPRIPAPRSPAPPSPTPPATEVSIVEALAVVVDDRASEWSVPTISTDLDLSDLDNTGPTKPPAGEVTVPGSPPALITGNTVVGPAPAGITGDTVVGEKLPRALREAAGRWPLPEAGRMPGQPEGDPAITPATLPPPGGSASSPPSFSSSSPATLPPPGGSTSLRGAPPSLPPPGSSASSSPFPAPPGASAISSPSFPAPAALLVADPEPSSSLSAPPPSPPPAPPSSLRASPPSPPPTPPPAAWASASAAAASFPQDDEPAAGRSLVLPFVLAGVALSLLVLVIVLALSQGDDPAEVASSDEKAADDAPSSTPSPSKAAPSDASEDAGDDDAEADEPRAPVGGVYPVVAALEARKVRALDVLLVATAWGKPSDYATAAAYCEGLDVEGVRGWRLPHIGELSSLAQANMISRGMFWSSTAADTFGDGHMAWNARRGHALPHGAQAVAVCVRGGETSGS